MIILADNGNEYLPAKTNTNERTNERIKLIEKAMPDGGNDSEY